MADTALDDKRTPAPGPVGIGGWLLLPMLGLFAAPIVGVLQFTAYAEVFSGWQYLDTRLAVFIVAETAGNIVLAVVAPVVLLFFMFKRLEMFPGWYMIWATAAPVFLLADAAVAYALFAEPGSEIFDKETVRGIARSFLSAAIWIPYMMRSERVANTFVN
ncbi:DUF2569 domain-containing protein [Aminobacter sp. SR38]|jgi:hypothetical protein|uniref:DUF2569 domain-containing protein n=1 Tax=Aminobacter sp. SR38 TaxID=2774562 RepID=UPI001781380C|nr:DUF2569 domain-containing protein [Aminobacter sp. SR38]QOF70231.1 DUF2569 domain-containing protein [Aminobacter sp. SR38]